ncbi:hypothetical protein [Magnetospirillum sp. UT-4]|uniref:hypothetical protein n=1 Tax=Magnetospirillum sp. UT-4 TaxID=2681467 RepID=UPI00137E3022|nr:hypothetical protein [Magnetospirillum sp. UT-4]CAA7615794.1 hypothetical protein MTBUT4_200081 [Magnetospirillum sp. UT-4]
MLRNELIIDLNLEQGGNRVSQFQPPMSVWAHYFCVNVYGPLPTFTLTDCKNGAAPEVRPVVQHDHNWTVEVSDAELPRPAILRLCKTGVDQYDYWVYRPADPEFAYVNWILDTYPNPLKGTELRRWVII